MPLLLTIMINNNGYCMMFSGTVLMVVVLREPLQTSIGLPFESKMQPLVISSGRHSPTIPSLSIQH